MENWPWSYFAVLACAAFLSDSAGTFNRLLVGPASTRVSYLPPWTYQSAAGAITSTMLAAVGVFSMWAVLIYGFFVARWYVVLAMLVAAWLVAFIWSLVFPTSNPTVRLLFCYFATITCLVLHLMR